MNGIAHDNNYEQENKVEPGLTSPDLSLVLAENAMISAFKALQHISEQLDKEKYVPIMEAFDNNGIATTALNELQLAMPSSLIRQAD